MKAQFFEDILAGKASLRDIYDYMGLWHKTVGTMPLAEFLGMSDEDYGKWVANDELLLNIYWKYVETRRNTQ